MKQLQRTSPFIAVLPRVQRKIPRDLFYTSLISALSADLRGATMISIMKYQDRIIHDPQIVGGEPVLKGTRVTLRSVLASLAEGATAAEIVADFPTLSEEDVRAAIVFAAASAGEDLPLAGTPVTR